MSVVNSVDLNVIFYTALNNINLSIYSLDLFVINNYLRSLTVYDKKNSQYSLIQYRINPKETYNLITTSL